MQKKKRAKWNRTAHFTIYTEATIFNAIFSLQQYRFVNSGRKNEERVAENYPSLIQHTPFVLKTVRKGFYTSYNIEFTSIYFLVPKLFVRTKNSNAFAFIYFFFFLDENSSRLIFMSNGIPSGTIKYCSSHLSKWWDPGISSKSFSTHFLGKMYVYR